MKVLYIYISIYLYKQVYTAAAAAAAEERNSGWHEQQPASTVDSAPRRNRPTRVKNGKKMKRNRNKRK